MPEPRARSIDDLYQEVRAYDLVLTTDGPLSLALNRRLDEPYLGHFATTPRELASGEFRPRDERRLFLALITQTDLSWKHASFLVEHILGCWEETGRLEAILEYAPFDTAETRRALEVIRETESAHRDLAQYSISDELDVAVIGEPSFTKLDRRILPAEYATVDPFGDEVFEPPAFHIYESATAIVDAVVENVSPATAENVAVVMRRGSQYPGLVEAAFEAAEIPFYGGPGFADDQRLRTFIRTLRTAVLTSEPRVGEFRPLLARFGIHPATVIDQYRVSEVEEPALDAMREFCEDLPGLSFEEALEWYGEWDEEPPGLREELEKLNLLAAPIDEDHLNDLEYYLQAFEVPVHREDSGVLLADATAAAYVDRPVVFYLGMDAEWTHSIPDRPWIDRETKDAEYFEQFQRLIQNGQDQYYLVQDSMGGEAVPPCLYLHEIFEQDFERFDDLPHVSHRVIARGRGDGFDRSSLGVDPEREALMSASSLSSFANCPRDVFFDRLVETEDQSYFRKGQLVHDFAEFYLAHPEIVEDVGVSGIVDVMVEAMVPFLERHEEEPVATELRAGVEVVMEYLAENPPAIADIAGYYRWEDEGNLFAETFGAPIESGVTEQWFENPSLGGKGKVDLFQDVDRLVDYKTGSQKSAKQVVDNAAIEEVSETPDFQAPLYLANHRHQQGGRLAFVFVHVLDLVDDWIAGEYALEDVETTLFYYPMSFAEFAATREAFERLCEGVAESNNRRKTLERLEFEAYQVFWREHTFPDGSDREVVVDAECTEEFIAYAREAVGEYKYVRQGCRSAMKQLQGMRERNFFLEDLDEFAGFLTEQLALLNEYRASRFPVGEPNFDRVTHRDLILADEAVSEDE